MTIRIAQRSDLDSLVVIYNQAVAEQATADLDPVTVESRRAWFQEHSNPRYPILVADESDEILGWLSVSEYRPGRQALRHTAEITYYVHTLHRRKGVASRLMCAAIEMCRTSEIRILFGILLEDNHASIGLLEHHGFERWGYLPRVANFDGREVGHLYYGRRLD